MVTSDFHTHTRRCRHAQGDVSEYVQNAAKTGLRRIGISDHIPFPDNRWIEERMDYSERDDYLADIIFAREQFPELQIFAGYEAEYVPEFESYFQNEILHGGMIQYLALGQHYFLEDGSWKSSYGGILLPDDLENYTNILIRGMESGLFAFVAHPDLFGNSYPAWDDACALQSHRIAQKAAELQLPLEINGYGFSKKPLITNQGARRMYPWEPFWEIVSHYQVPVIINSDAHSPLAVRGNFSQAITLAQRYHLRVCNDSIQFS